jgi:hypothetical protein
MNSQLVCDALQKFDVSLNHGTRSLGEKRQKPRLKLCQARYCGSAWPGIEQVGAWPTALIV